MLIMKKILTLLFLDISQCEVEGYDLMQGDKHDTNRRWTYVDRVNTFEFDGIVTSVEFYAGSPASDRPWDDYVRPLILGIFRPNGGGDCDFDLINKYRVAPEQVAVGYIEV